VGGAAAVRSAISSEPSRVPIVERTGDALVAVILRAGDRPLLSADDDDLGLCGQDLDAGAHVCRMNERSSIDSADDVTSGELESQVQVARRRGAGVLHDLGVPESVAIEG